MLALILMQKNIPIIFLHKYKHKYKCMRFKMIDIIRNMSLQGKLYSVEFLYKISLQERMSII